jgi:uncharacterized SAM-binding protein YcdF (DUF218 family)
LKVIKLRIKAIAAIKNDRPIRFACVASRYFMPRAGLLKKRLRGFGS